MNLAIVGATGLVGSELLKVIDELKLEYNKLFMVASENSIGKKLQYNNKEYTIIGLEDAVNEDIDIAIFSAGGESSKLWAPKFAQNGIKVIDNSSAWRNDISKKLIVPEINAHLLNKDDMIISNPNCSTIQMVHALSKIHEKFRIKRLVISTYQSVSGTGKAAVDQLYGERSNKNVKMVYPYKIDMNCIPHGGKFLDNGYTEEEMKLVHETRKIFNDNSINITATVVRVPVIGGHSESVNVELHNAFEINELYELLRQTPNIVIQDNIDTNTYPMPLMSHNKNHTFVGRIRRDESCENAFNIWIVADNLRKGAATNAVQIAEYISSNNLI